tara:strand:+ start:2207 stop:2374 length:168 start_codon:yes stop_codon:yes gene_type:complete
VEKVGTKSVGYVPADAVVLPWMKANGTAMAAKTNRVANQDVMISQTNRSSLKSQA